jgi:Flp pilus assembly protein TadG
MRPWLGHHTIWRGEDVGSALKACAGDERGAIMPIMAAVMMIAAGGAALAVDLGRAYSVRADLQAAADAAALSAAIMLPDVEEARMAAQLTVYRTLPDLKPVLTADDIDFGTWNASERRIEKGSGDASAVQVTVQLSESRGNALETLFAGVFGENAMDIASSATAGKNGTFCLLALDQKGKGLEVKKDSELEMRACGAQVNSTAKEALKVEGKKSSLLGDGFCVTGGASVKGGATVSPEPSEGCPPHVDPLAELDIPLAGACTDNTVDFHNETVTFSPGRVFCDGLKLTGDTRAFMQPGTYFVVDGKFELKGEALLEGDGVTIVLQGEKAEIDIKENAAVQLTAPTSGDLKGLLIVQNDALGAPTRRASKDDDDDDDDDAKRELLDNKWDSKAPSELTGVIYLPRDRFTTKLNINITGTDACFVVIAEEIKVDGEARMLIDLSGSGCRGNLPAAFNRKVVLLS